MKPSGLAARIALAAASVLVSLMALEVGWCAAGRRRSAIGATWRAADDRDRRRQRLLLRRRRAARLGTAALVPVGEIQRHRGHPRDAFHTPLGTGPPVLVTGSSFALGDEAADGETWPAFLLGLIGRRVMRTEELAPRRRPAVVIVSFTAGDIWRTEQSVAFGATSPISPWSTAISSSGTCRWRHLFQAAAVALGGAPVRPIDAGAGERGAAFDRRRLVLRGSPGPAGR
ncbi:MAG: hypothetical protein JO339_06210 [Alphaproteobacteria bacterium]|nr:hypothetical protein [Alphaproteobacteria bacterium]